MVKCEMKRPLVPLYASSDQEECFCLFFFSFLCPVFIVNVQIFHRCFQVVLFLHFRGNVCYEAQGSFILSCKCTSFSMTHSVSNNRWRQEELWMFWSNFTSHMWSSKMANILHINYILKQIVVWKIALNEEIIQSLIKTSMCLFW